VVERPGKDLEGSNRGLIELLSWNLSLMAG
jgi:hypothetical protein